MRNVLLSLCLAVPLVGVGVVVGDLRGRLAQLECAPRADPAMVSAIDRELEQLSRQVDASILAIGSLSREQGKTIELDQRLSDLKCELEDASRDIDAQRARIAQWDSIQDQIGPKAVDARFAQLRTRVEDRWKANDCSARKWKADPRGQHLPGSVSLANLARLHTPRARLPSFGSRSSYAHLAVPRRRRLSPVVHRV